MYAIVEIAGRQFKVAEKRTIEVPRLQSEEGSTIEFDKVLFYSGDKIEIGNPTVDGCKVVATVKEHAKDDKVISFKKKRRKGYKVKKGHRQPLTKITVNSITI